MSRIKTELTFTIHTTRDQRDEMLSQINDALFTLEKTLGVFDCYPKFIEPELRMSPYYQHYVLATFLLDEIEVMEFSIVPLVDRLLRFAQEAERARQQGIVYASKPTKGTTVMSQEPNLDAC